MDLDLIERLMRLLENSSVNELELTENGTRIRLSKTLAAPPPPTGPRAAASTAGARAEAAASPAEPGCARRRQP